MLPVSKRMLAHDLQKRFTMKITPQFLITLLLGLFLMGCGSDQPSSDQAPAPASTTPKWKIDKEMMVFLRSAEKAVADFSPTEGADYSALAEDLQGKIALLTENCTMTGAAHDALHAWLVPYMELVDTFGNASDAATSKGIFQKIEAAFKAFDQQFE